MSEILKSAVISIVGRPNVGKSTLTNRLVGRKVAIVSNKPQTTRTRITGILNRDTCQFVFLDTPGLHKPRSRLGDFMVKVVTDTVSDVDVAALLGELLVGGARRRRQRSDPDDGAVQRLKAGFVEQRQRLARGGTDEQIEQLAVHSMKPWVNCR